jgi:hypothetical protein
MHAIRVGEYGECVGVIECCRMEGVSYAKNTQLGQTGGVAIAGALQRMPSLTALRYVVGEGASGVAVGRMGCGLCLCWTLSVTSVGRAVQRSRGPCDMCHC